MVECCEEQTFAAIRRFGMLHNVIGIIIGPRVLDVEQVRAIDAPSRDEVRSVRAAKVSDWQI